MDIQNTIKQNIKSAIKKAGMTQRSFCKDAGINYDLFTQYTTVKKRKVPHEWIEKIAEHLKISIDSIYGR